MRTLSLLVAALGLAAAVPAQLQPGDYVIPDFGNKTVWRVTPQGVVTSLHSGPPFSGLSSVAFAPNGDLVVADYNANVLWRQPAAGGSFVKQANVTAPIRIAFDRDGTVLVCSLTTPGLLRVDDGGNVTPIYQGAPLSRPFDVAVDDDGSYLLVDDSTKALYRITPSGMLSTIVQGQGLQLPQGVAVFSDGDYAVMDGIVDALFRVPRAGGMPQVVIQQPVLGNPEGIIDDFEGRMVLAEAGAPNGARLVEVDRQGTLRVIASGMPMQAPQDVARAPNVTGPVQAQVAQFTSLTLRLPGYANRPYVVFASLSLYPGFALAGIGKASPLNPDGVFFLSVGANNGLFIGWGGMLDASATAQPMLLVLPGLPSLQLHVQAVAVDFTQPFGIGAFSNVHPLHL